MEFIKSGKGKSVEMRNKTNKKEVNMKKYIIAARYDGFGERMLAFLNAIYISRETDLEFKYIWIYSPYASQDLGRFNYLSVNVANPLDDILPENKVFGEHFIKQYSFTEPVDMIPDGDNLMSKNANLKLKNIDKDYYPLENQFGYFSTQYDLSVICEDVEPLHYYSNIKDIWNNIDFKDNIKNVIKKANELGFLNNFVAFHLRLGEAIYYDNGNNAFFAKKKFVPIHLAIQAIKDELENDSLIVIFSDDLNSIRSLKDFFAKHYPNFQHKILIFKDFVEQYKFSHFEATIFELEIMKKALKIYSSGRSGFSNLAFRIGGGKSEFVSIHDLYSNKEKYDIILENIDKIKLHPYQKAFSYLHAYLSSENIGMSTLVQKNIIEQALKLTPNNCYIYRFIYMYILLKEKDYNQVEFYLKKHIDDDRDYFMRNLLQIDGYNNTLLYSFIFLEFLDTPKQYPYMLYVLYRVYLSKCKLNYYDKNEVEYKLMLKNCFYLFNAIVELGQYHYCSNMFGASDRVKNHLSYKIGMKFLKATNFMNIIKLPFAILSICLKHKKDQAVYNSMIRVNPKLALFPLESYADYNEALRITNYLSYRLGNAFIKHPITFIFRIYGIYQKWKREKRGK